MTRPQVNDEASPFFVDLTTLHSFQERYPFTEAELEILVRCHEQLQSSTESFLVALATASPYSVFFLPDYTAEDRVTWLEDHVLPAGFSNQLRAAIAADAFVEYAHQGVDKSLERFLEGIADTGRRGAREALGVFYRCCEGSIDPEAAVADLAVRLVVATQLWQSPTVPDKNAFLQEFEENYQPTIDRMTQSLRDFVNEKHENTKEPHSSHITVLKERIFVEWAEDKFPMLYINLTSLVNNLLFHGLHKSAEEFAPVSPYCCYMSLSLPQLNCTSEILSPGVAMSLACMDPCLTGKFHRLYSSFCDGRSFNRLEYGILGYEGPTCVLILTTADAVLGAFTNTRWRACRDTSDHTGDEAFLFTLQPLLNVYRMSSDEAKSNLWYLHSLELASSSRHVTSPEGLGWGGTNEMPRLWIPSEFERCHAGGWDKTYQQGPLLPEGCCEGFEIKCLEVWAVGGEERIEQGLAQQAMTRRQTTEALEKARVVHDKREFVGDLQNMPLTKLFQHQAMTRGRNDMVLDEKHGGYKIAD